MYILNTNSLLEEIVVFYDEHVMYNCNTNMVITGLAETEYGW